MVTSFFCRYRNKTKHRWEISKVMSKFLNNLDKIMNKAVEVGGNLGEVRSRLYGGCEGKERT